MLGRGLAVGVKQDVGIDGQHDGSLSESGKTRIGIGKGGLAELGGAQTFPADLAGGGWCPFGLVCLRRLGINLEQKLGSPAEGLRQGPFTLLGEMPEFAKQLLRDLDLCLGHAGDCPVPSNPGQDASLDINPRFALTLAVALRFAGEG